METTPDQCLSKKWDTFGPAESQQNPSECPTSSYQVRSAAPGNFSALILPSTAPHFAFHAR
jgi:hypothetical protein